MSPLQRIGWTVCGLAWMYCFAVVAAASWLELDGWMKAFFFIAMLEAAILRVASPAMGIEWAPVGSKQ